MSAVVVIGAGLAGLSAARVLHDAGHDVTVIDKSRGVGGRMATRRIGDAVFDHGAQFFTVRSGEFGAVVDTAVEAGAVEVWCHGFDGHDGYPRYRGAAGMTSLAKHLRTGLAADGVVFRLGERIEQVSASGIGWSLNAVSSSYVADAVVVTSPAPQTLDLLDAGHVSVDAELRESLDSIDWKRAFALMLVLDGPSAMTDVGGDQRTEHDLFTFVADNHLKGISPVPALTLHTNGEFTLERWDDDCEAVRAELIAAASRWIGSAAVVDSQLHAWKFAAPRPALAQPFAELQSPDGAPLLLAGEAFGGPKVEGAFRSGLAAGSALADRL